MEILLVVVTLRSTVYLKSHNFAHFDIGCLKLEIILKIWVFKVFNAILIKTFKNFQETIRLMRL